MDKERIISRVERSLRQEETARSNSARAAFLRAFMKELGSAEGKRVIETWGKAKADPDKFVGAMTAFGQSLTR